MVKSKDWQNALARTLRWRYLVLDEGELYALRSSTSCPALSMQHNCVSCAHARHLDTVLHQHAGCSLSPVT